MDIDLYREHADNTEEFLRTTYQDLDQHCEMESLWVDFHRMAESMRADINSQLGKPAVEKLSFLFQGWDRTKGTVWGDCFITWAGELEQIMPHHIMVSFESLVPFVVEHYEDKMDELLANQPPAGNA